jgi:hypothetical protein
MPSPVYARSLVIVGTLTAVLAMILYSQLGRVANLHVSLTTLNAAAILGISMTLLGLLGTLIGSVVWARRAPLSHVLGLGASEGIVAFLLAVSVDINIHGPTAIVILVVFAGAIGCVAILSIAASRFALRDATK